MCVHVYVCACLCLYVPVCGDMRDLIYLCLYVHVCGVCMCFYLCVHVEARGQRWMSLSVHSIFEIRELVY